MKYLITFLTVISISMSLLAQTCKWKEDNTDAFSGKKYLLSKETYVLGKKSKSLRLRLELNNEIISVVAIYEHGEVLSDSRVSNPKLDLKLANGKIISVESRKTFSVSTGPRTNVADITSRVELKYTIEKRDALIIAESNIEAIKITINANEYTFFLKGKKAEKYTDYFRCIVKD